MINTYTTEHLMLREEMMAIAGWYEQSIGFDKIQNVSDNKNVFALNNGYLAGTIQEVSSDDLDDIAGALKAFHSFTEESGIPFLYVNAGSKVSDIKREEELPSYAVEFGHQNGVELLARLDDAGIDTLDFRKEIKAAGMDHYEAFYRTDHHWKTETGFWAAGVIARRLNLDYGFEFDPACFDHNNYDKSVYPKCFMGSQGRIYGLKDDQLEDYTKFLPAYPTNFNIRIPSRKVNLSGTFADTLVDFSPLVNLDTMDHAQDVDAYHSWRWRNDALGQIRNLNVKDNKGKKILMLQDSYAWALTPYLAADIEFVDMIMPTEFNGSIREYIRQTKPDMVILLYYEGEIKPIDWNRHTSQFDLR